MLQSFAALYARFILQIFRREDLRFLIIESAVRNNTLIYHAAFIDDPFLGLFESLLGKILNRHTLRRRVVLHAGG